MGGETAVADVVYDFLTFFSQMTMIDQCVTESIAFAEMAHIARALCCVRRFGVESGDETVDILRFYLISLYHPSVISAYSHAVIVDSCASIFSARIAGWIVAEELWHQVHENLLSICTRGETEP